MINLGFLNKIIKDCFTGKTNENYDLAHLLWFLGGCVMIFVPLYSVIVIHAVPNYLELGGGLGAYMAGGGAGIAFKYKAEVNKTE